LKEWKKNIRAVAPYTPGEQPQSNNVIKLNTNENPYPPSPRVAEAIASVDTERLRLYPSIACDELKAALMENYPVKAEEIFLGNGSDEVLAIAFQTFFESDKPVLFADVTYSFYDVWCKMYRVKYEKVPLDESFRYNPKDYYKENGGVIITNPNAPTSICMGLEDIKDIVEHNRDVIVIVDEAYIDFGGTSAVELIHEYDNLVIVQTYSKSRSLAGIRVGYAMAQSELIAAMDAVKNSFNSYTLSTISQVAATASALDKEYMAETAGKIKATRQWTIDKLAKLGFETLDSSANFIFTTNKAVKAEALFTYLKSKNIYVRYFNKPRISEYLRITIGTQPEMEALIKAIEDFTALK
jgi:histidinol-phosphate aminotransferase